MFYFLKKTNIFVFMGNGKSFLVIQQKMIGDVLTSTIICDNIKQQYPDAKIDYVANDNTLAVLENNPNIDNIIVFKKEYRNDKLAFYKFLKDLRKKKYYFLVDAYGKLESNIMSVFSRAKIKVSYHKLYSSWIYTNTYPTYTEAEKNITLAVKNRIGLLEKLQIPEDKIITIPKIYLSETEQHNAELFLEENGISAKEEIIMISVLGSSPSKTYPPIYMAKVIDIICTYKNYTILFNYIPSQEEEALNIYNLCNSHSQSLIKFNVFSNSLRGFLSLAGKCKALIGNEGGAINMAKALEVPTLAIFAPFTGKAGWFIETGKHKAIHLKDIQPELFTNKSRKEIIEDAYSFYSNFEPSLFETELLDFLKSL